MVIAVFQLLCYTTEDKDWEIILNFFRYPLLCLGFAWWIAGIVARYREIGNICSGDYVTADNANVDRSLYSMGSGRFINIYYTVYLWGLIVGCSCICCFGIWAGVMR